MTATTKKKLVAAIEDINSNLDLESPLPTDEDLEELIEILCEEGKAKDGGFYENDHLKASTFRTLKAIGIEIKPGGADEAKETKTEPEPEPATRKGGRKVKRGAKKEKSGKADKPKAPKKAKASGGNGTPWKGVKRQKPPKEIKDGAKVKLLRKENPHAKGTKMHGYFAKLKDGATVAAIVKRGVPRKEIKFYISVGVVKLVGNK